MISQHRVETRILVLSDTHAALPGPVKTPDLPYSQPFPSTDIAIHCGDLTSTGKLHEHYRALELLKQLPAPTKLVIPGNHDLTLDRAYCATHPHLYAWSRPHNDEDLREAEKVYTGTDACQAGIVYLVEGKHSLKLSNNADLQIYVSAYTPAFCDWAFAYDRTEDRFNKSRTISDFTPHPPSQHQSTELMPSFSSSSLTNVDIVVTHGPPIGILDQTTRNDSVGCENLLRGISRCKPLLHCFGHIHEAWGSAHRSWKNDDDNGNRKENGLDLTQSLNSEVEVRVGSCAYIDATNVEQGMETVFVNASIMDVHYMPRQRPWVVDLMLPAAQD